MLAPVSKEGKAGRALPWLNIVTFVVVLVFNAISSAGLLGGYSQGDTSRLYQVLLTPKGNAFSIWGLIYFGVAVFVVWQAIPSLRNDDIVFGKIGWWFILSNFFNVMWIVLFAQTKPVGWIWASSVFLFLIFGSLLHIILRINVFRRALVADPSAAPKSATNTMKLVLEYFCVDFTFSIYCGWTTVASILNVSLALIGSGWYGGSAGQATWAIIILCVATAIFLLTVFTRFNWAYGLVYAWAAYWISVNEENCTAVAGINFSLDECKSVQLTAQITSIILLVVSCAALLLYSVKACKRANEAGVSTSHGQPITSDNTEGVQLHQA